MSDGKWTLALLLSTVPFSASADASLECSIGLANQVEIAACVAEAEATVDRAIEITLGSTMNAAKELDEITGREVAVPALNSSQSAWSAYRDAHCEYIGSTFGGGSGTGIAIRTCRVELGRARINEVMRFVQ